jgi:hypothetical protein
LQVNNDFASAKPDQVLPQQQSIAARVNSITQKQPRLAESCYMWLQRMLALLCPAPSDPMRAGADTPTRFVAELYDDAQHGIAFDTFLQSDKACMFVLLASSRAFHVTFDVPKCGSYVSLIYVLKPQGASKLAWSAATLASALQVC